MSRVLRLALPTAVAALTTGPGVDLWDPLDAEIVGAVTSLSVMVGEIAGGVDWVGGAAHGPGIGPRASESYGAALLELHAVLRRSAPEGFGLVKVHGASGKPLWAHSRFVGCYRPPPATVP
ncbi:MAG: hypothetical protein ACT4PW_12855 [Acidimicrobiia bacterium]